MPLSAVSFCRLARLIELCHLPSQIGIPVSPTVADIGGDTSSLDQMEADHIRQILAVDRTRLKRPPQNWESTPARSIENENDMGFD